MVPLKTIDPIWLSIRQEAQEAIADETLLGAFMHSSLLNHRTLEEAVAHRVADRLDHPDVPADLIRHAFADLVADDKDFGTSVRVVSFGEFC